jgi:hypothetical protein
MSEISKVIPSNSSSIQKSNVTTSIGSLGLGSSASKTSPVIISVSSSTPRSPVSIESLIGNNNMTKHKQIHGATPYHPVNINIVNPMDQKGRGYKLLIDRDYGCAFVNEVKKIQQSGKKQKISLDNNSDYRDALKHVESALLVLKNDSSVEKIELENVKKELLKYTKDEFYVFENQIKCTVVIDGLTIPGQIIGMDDGELAIVKTAKGIFGVTLNNNIQIGGRVPEKSIFTKSSIAKTSSTPSPGYGSLSISSGSLSISSGSLSISSGSLSNGSSFSRLSSSALSSNISPGSQISSPYLATSEYGSSEKKSSSPGIGASNLHHSNTMEPDLDDYDESANEMMDDSEDGTSTEQVLAGLSLIRNSSPVNKSSQISTPGATPRATPGATPRATPGTTPRATPGTTPRATPGTTPRATPGATPRARVTKPMKLDMKNNANSQENIKFMKAGKRDNVGIMESTGTNTKSPKKHVSDYYSESTSAVDGLCE